MLQVKSKIMEQQVFWNICMEFIRFCTFFWMPVRVTDTYSGALYGFPCGVEEHADVLLWVFTIYADVVLEAVIVIPPISVVDLCSCAKENLAAFY